MEKHSIGIFCGVRIFIRFFLYSIGYTDAVKEIIKKETTNKNPVDSSAIINTTNKNPTCSSEHCSNEQ